MAEPKPRIPAEPGIWVLIFGDLLIFSALFVTFVNGRHDAPALFASDHARLDRMLGLINTLLLLTSSLCVAIGIHRMRSGRDGASRLGIAILCGAGFVAVKATEYALKARAGLTPQTDDFFMYYFAFTGIHLLHVLLGLGALIWARAAMLGYCPVERQVMIESAAIFWHLVDLLWIILFTLFYVLGG